MNQKKGCLLPIFPHLTIGPEQSTIPLLTQGEVMHCTAALPARITVPDCPLQRLKRKLASISPEEHKW